MSCEVYLETSLHLSLHWPHNDLERILVSLYRR